MVAPCNDALVSKTSDPTHQVGSRRVASAFAVEGRAGKLPDPRSMCTCLVGLWRMHQACLFCACIRDTWLVLLFLFSHPEPTRWDKAGASGLCWSAFSAPRAFTTAAKKKESYSHCSPSIAHEAQSDEMIIFNVRESRCLTVSRVEVVKCLLWECSRFASRSQIRLLLDFYLTHGVLTPTSVTCVSTLSHSS